MAKISFLKTADNITEKLNAMVERGRDVRAFMVRVVYPSYQRHQMQRWMTEGSSEGYPWPKLNSLYEAYKKKRFSDYPGSGTKMLIATGALVESVIGRQLGGSIPSDGSSNINSVKGHNVMTSATSIIVATEVEYAKYVNEKRTMFKFRDDFRAELKKKFQAWMIKGQTVG